MPASFTLYLPHRPDDLEFEADMQDLYERLELMPYVSEQRLRQELMVIMNKYTRRTEH